MSSGSTVHNFGLREKAQLMSASEMERTLLRLAHEIVEKNGGIEMTAPGTLLISKMLAPETEKPLTAGRVEMSHMDKESNILGAIACGTIDGLL